MNISKSSMSAILICSLFLLLIPSHIANIDQKILAATEQPTSIILSSSAVEIMHIGTFDKSFEDVNWVGWNANGSLLAITYREDNHIRILDAKSGQPKFVIAALAVIDGIRLVSWSPNGKYLAYALVDPDTVIYVWDMSSDKPKIHSIFSSTGQQPNFSWSPDSKQIISVGAFGELQDQWKVFVWNVNDGTQLAQLIDIHDPIAEVFWNPNGKTIATLTVDAAAYYSLQVRNAKTLQILAQFPNADPSLVVSGDVSWSADGTKLAGALCSPIIGSCAMWIWHMQDNQILRPFHEDQQSYINAPLALSPNGKILATAALGANYVWDVQTGHLISSLDGKPGWVSSLSWSPDGTMLATGSLDGSIRIWSIG